MKIEKIVGILLLTVGLLAASSAPTFSQEATAVESSDTTTARASAQASAPKTPAAPQLPVCYDPIRTSIALASLAALAGGCYYLSTHPDLLPPEVSKLGTSLHSVITQGLLSAGQMANYLTKYSWLPAATPEDSPDLIAAREVETNAKKQILYAATGLTALPSAIEIKNALFVTAAGGIQQVIELLKDDVRSAEQIYKDVAYDYQYAKGLMTTPKAVARLEVVGMKLASLEADVHAFNQITTELRRGKLAHARLISFATRRDELKKEISEIVAQLE